jgi:hypothetical protein
MTAPWDCLAIVPGRSDFALSRLSRPTGGARPSWHLVDLTDEGQDTYTLEVEMTTREMGCPSVAPTAKGYTMAWQNSDGTYFSDVDTRPRTTDAGAGSDGGGDAGPADAGTTNSIFVTSDIVRGAVRFGGPDRQPRVACIASMGKEFSITYDASSGPLVDRFTIFGLPKGSSLHLPSRGRSGGASAWPLIDAAYLTYLDRGPDPAMDQRFFAKVDCPEL